MKADYLSYKKATSVSLLGLVLQVGLGLALLVYSFLARPDFDITKVDPTRGFVWSGDESARTGALFILLGSVIWLVLAVLFDQHRRERIEQMEMEALNASGARDSSAFAGGEGADFRVAHNRLVWMHKFLVPAVSLLYGGALIALGVWRYYATRTVLKSEFHSTASFGVIISLSFTIAIVGFVFARYVAGMAKQPVWSHLRAGAGAAVGAAVFGLVTTIVQFIDKVGPSEPVQWLHVVWPWVMVGLGAEVILSFLAGIYSPRKPGAFPRPALDSTMLSFAAAPDRIAASIGDALNYQFGFDVTGNWFYQLLTRSAATLVLLGAVVVWLLSCIGIVEPNEQGLRVRFGVKQGATLGPGPVLKLPWPMEHIETYKTTVVRRLDLGAKEPNIKGNKAVLWTNDHGVGEETYFVVRPAADDAADPGTAQTGLKDVYLAVVEIPLYYTVEDLAKFDALGTPEQVEDTLRSIGQSEAMQLLGTMRIDDVLGSGRDTISTTLKKKLTERFAALGNGQGAGVTVVYVGVEGVHPPREASAAFEDVVKAAHLRAGQIQSALKDADTKVIEVAGDTATAEKIVGAIDELNRLADAKANEAAMKAKQQEVEKLVIAAGGTAASTIQEARAGRWSRHMAARASSDAFVGQLAGFRAAPDVYLAKMYFDTLRESLAHSRLYIVADNDHMHINTNLEDLNTGGSMFNVGPKKEP